MTGEEITKVRAAADAIFDHRANAHGYKRLVMDACALAIYDETRRADLIDTFGQIDFIAGLILSALEAEAFDTAQRAYIILLEIRSEANCEVAKSMVGDFNKKQFQDAKHRKKSSKGGLNKGGDLKLFLESCARHIRDEGWPLVTKKLIAEAKLEGWCVSKTLEPAKYKFVSPDGSIRGKRNVNDFISNFKKRSGEK